MPLGLGAAYGTAKSGVGVANMGVLHSEMVMKSIIPIIMAGVLGIYGLIVAVLLGSGSECSPCHDPTPTNPRKSHEASMCA